MRNIYIILLITLAAVTATGCKKYLNINTDPDTTQEPSSASVLPACLAAIPTAYQSDGGLYLAKYVQNWLTAGNANANQYDQQGYAWAGATMGANWTLTYIANNNLNYIIANSTLKTDQPEYVGAAYVLKALAFQGTTDYNGDIPFSEAFIEDKYVFKYDSQQVVYRGVDSLCRIALQYFDIAAGKTVNTLSRGDYVYSGDLVKWKKFVYGLMARNWHHLTNKAAYNTNYADSVIKFCDLSMTTVADDFGVPFDANLNNNSNYFGPARGNMELLRQSGFIIRLLDGTALAGNSLSDSRDPRMAYMLTVSNDTTNGNGGYRGVEPGTGDPFSTLGSPSTYLVNGLPPASGTALTNYNNSRKKVAVAYADSTYVNSGANSFGVAGGKYLFQNKAIFPIMTYAELQFVKAEAALRKGATAVAYDAYLKGINAHFDFINKSYTNPRGVTNLYNGAPISAAARAKYLAGPNVKKTAGQLTLTDIMVQKYIALWGWGFLETWVDMRRYHYTDIDPVTNEQVYKTFALPTPLYSSNEGKPVYRVRPHFTSEYTYNISELQRIGVTKQDYHTREMWFSLP